MVTFFAFIGRKIPPFSKVYALDDAARDPMPSHLPYAGMTWLLHTIKDNMTAEAEP
jgi:hypothetical protein